jgi:transglutaminase-like putative cysteine protease
LFLITLVKFHIHHRTRYLYAAKVSFGPHRLMFRPRESHSIQLESFSIKITPAHRLRWMRDLYENNVGLLDLTEPSSELVIVSECYLKALQENPFDFMIDKQAIEYPFVYDYEIAAQLAPLCAPIYIRDTERIKSWLHPYWHPGRRIGTFDLLQQLNKVIYRDIRYQRRERRGVQSPAETLEKNSGSCRDFAALFMETCRFMGLAARFVSGYMYSSEITGRMSMHSWAEVYLPGAGWIGFDPSWGILAASQYIPVAVNRHPEHAPPISGTYFGYAREFLRTEVDLYVKKVDSPHPSKELPKSTQEIPATMMPENGIRSKSSRASEDWPSAV